MSAKLLSNLPPWKEVAPENELESRANPPTLAPNRIALLEFEEV